MKRNESSFWHRPPAGIPADGVLDVATLGAPEGLLEGPELGESDGVKLGLVDGLPEGMALGDSDGEALGNALGSIDG